MSMRGLRGDTLQASRILADTHIRKSHCLNISANTDMSEPTTPPELAALQQAVDGLLFPSETDASLTPFFWPQDESALKEATTAPDQLAKLAGFSADIPIKSVKLETFFHPVTREEEWHNAEEKAQVEKFKRLM